MRRALVLSAFVLLSLAAWAASPPKLTPPSATPASVERVQAEPDAHHYELVAELRGEAVSSELDTVLTNEALKAEATVVKLDRAVPSANGLKVRFEARAFRVTSAQLLSAQR